MDRILIGFLFAASVLLLSNVSSAPAQVPDGTVRLTSRLVSPGIGLSWGNGVLTYKGQDYPFTFQAKGLFRDVDARITAAELSGQVFNLNAWHCLAARTTRLSGHFRCRRWHSATMKNLNGVIVNLVSTIEGRKFILGRDGMHRTQKQKPEKISANRRMIQFAAETGVGPAAGVRNETRRLGCCAPGYGGAGGSTVAIRAAKWISRMLF
jgi:hypothetical protein